MGNQVESVHEAAIVEYAAWHAVAIGTIFTAAERQGHGTTEQLHTHTHTSQAEGKNTQKQIS